MRNTLRMSDRVLFPRRFLILVGIAGVLLAAYSPIGAQLAAPMTVRGTVAGSYFTPPASGTPSSTVASYYRFAKVCVDANNNGACDLGEVSTTTDIAGGFFLRSQSAGPLVAEIGTTSINGGHPVTQRNVFRAALAQIAEGTGAGSSAVAAATVVITSLSTEVMRMMEADGLDYQTAKQNLATRLGIPTSQILGDPGKTTDQAIRKALLTESVILNNRFALAARMVDRGDVSPAALAVNPSATGPVVTIKEAQQAAMNLEGIPRYDHIFIIMLENKQTPTIKNSVFAPKINTYLNAYNQFTSYFATGNPSEPNRLAVGAADDFGITDDSAWNCFPSGTSAVNGVEDLPLPPGLGPCTNTTNHNIKNKPNLFNAMTAGGMTWRLYSETQNPGRDWRLDGVADSTIVAPDHIYPAGSPVGAIGTPGLMVRLAGLLYATKHNSSIPFQNVRSAPEFVTSNRTMGGGQWDQAFLNSPSTPAGWDPDQLGTDLWSGDVGHLNFLEPDQCDDMHGVTLQGTVPPSTTPRTASDCSGNALIYRSDLYTDYLIQKIQASPVWTNPQKRVAIVIMDHEGTATTGFNSCCGWNPSAGASIAGKSLGVLVNDPEGTVSVDTTIARYNQGNKGHGTSVFGVLTNQLSAPKGVVDSDASSHISFVRTLQDMFGLADPGDDWSYMNRSKYTANFIATYLPLLPEYASSADPHFDAVRPMNHAYVIPAGYFQKSGFVTPPGAQIGPDADQRNAWALK